jgi:hypothetical protein
MSRSSIVVPFVMFRWARVVAVAVCIVASLQLSRSQESAPGLIAGRVLDAETGTPLADAIVFASGTATGTSTALDGSFRLGPLLPGTYDVVASRVGYARVSRECTVTPRDTLGVEFRLPPRPVEPGGIDILGTGDSAAEQLFLPEPAEGQYRLFPFPKTHPVGALFTPGALYLYSLGITKLDGEACLSGWLLYQNLLDTVRSFDPLRDISVTVVSRAGTYPPAAPLPADLVHAIVSADSAQSLINEAVDPFFSAAWRVNDLIRPGYSRKFGPMDAAFGTDADLSGRLKIIYNIPPTSNRPGASAGYLTRVYRESTHLGILRGANVAPGAALDGMLFFPLPGIAPEAGRSGGGATADPGSYTLSIRTPDGVREVIFHAH